MRSSYFSNVTSSTTQSGVFKVPKLPTTRHKPSGNNELVNQIEGPTLEALNRYKQQLDELWEVQVRLLPPEEVIGSLQNYQTEVNARCMEKITRQLNIGNRFPPSEGSVCGTTISRNTRPPTFFPLSASQERRALQYSQQTNGDVQSNSSRMTAPCPVHNSERSELMVPKVSARGRKRPAPSEYNLRAVDEQAEEDSIISYFREDNIRKGRTNAPKVNAIVTRKRADVKSRVNPSSKENVPLRRGRKRVSVSLQTSTVTVTKTSVRKGAGDSVYGDVKRKRQSKKPFRDSFIYSLPSKGNKTLKSGRENEDSLLTNTEESSANIQKKSVEVTSKAAQKKIVQYSSDNTSSMNTRSSGGFSATSTPLVTVSKKVRQLPRRAATQPVTKKTMVSYESEESCENSEYSDFDL